MTIFWIAGIITVLLISFFPLKDPKPTPKPRDPFDVLFPGVRDERDR